MRDPEEEALLAAAIEEAPASVAAGQVVLHAIVREWLRDLAAGRYRPPPSPAAKRTG